MSEEEPKIDQDPSGSENLENQTSEANDKTDAENGLRPPTSKSTKDEVKLIDCFIQNRLHLHFSRNGNVNIFCSKLFPRFNFQIFPHM